MFILLHWRCRNHWGDPSVKTFVCELQIHHQVSDCDCDMTSFVFSVCANDTPLLSSRVWFPPRCWHLILQAETGLCHQAPNMIAPKSSMPDT